jgi:TctA family transporter
MGPAAEAFSDLAGSPLTLAGLLLGTLAGLLAGLTPGVSGRAGLVLVIPVAVALGPSAGAVFLIAFHSVVHTSGSIPAILLGAPTSSAEAATAIDGHAMARKGQGARATGATLAASAIGGLVGALFLFLAVPAALSLIAHIGTPEIAALSALGLLSISALAGGRLAAGLMTAALGLLIGAVGVDPFTGSERFTFGSLDLWDGVNAAALVTGLFVVPELLERTRETPPARAADAGIGGVIAGCMEVWRHRWLALRSSVIGVLVGLVPGMGVSAAVWIAYGHARQSHPSDVPYGEGAVAGVIAPEAANNSKEGGALVPTLFLGIPASTGMGILLAGFATLGIELGPRLLTSRPEFIFLMGWSNVLSNLIAVPICLVLAPAMARFSTLRRELVIPVALAAALTATVLTAPGPAVLIQLALFTALGLLLKAADLPRAPLLLGFVLGPGLESGLVRSAMVYGWPALQRPGVLILIGLAALILILSLRRPPPDQVEREKGVGVMLPPVAGLIGLLSLGAVLVGLRLSLSAAMILYLGAAIALIAGGVTVMRLMRRKGMAEPVEAPDWTGLLLFGGALAMSAISLPAAAAIFVTLGLAVRAGLGYARAGAVGLAVALAVTGLETLIR